jgi:uncharacterized membrane protein
MSGTYAPAPPGANPTEAARNLALVIHGLYAVGMFVGLTAIIGVVIAYLKRGDAAGTIYESHFTYAIRTFWIGLVIFFVGWLLSFILIGLPILAFGWVWTIIRVVRAFLSWNDRKPIDNPERFF